MDTSRAKFPDGRVAGQDDSERIENHFDHEAPPAAIGQKERRMQGRAYTFWTGLLGDRTFPPTSALDPAHLPDFAPYSVLLDFTHGGDRPAIRHLGDELARECGVDRPIEQFSQVPDPSLLTRIADYYGKVIANQAPVGFEAEFIGQNGATVLYRGILLPFSHDNARIDTIYGVINWKEFADPRTTEDLLREIGAVGEPKRGAAPMIEWADAPVDVGGAIPPTD